MKKTLEMDEATARRLYDSASPEFKEMLEESFGKSTLVGKITDRIKNYSDVLAITGTAESDDEVKVRGFNDMENEVVKNLIKKIRIAKVYNEGWIPKRGERRYYPWFNISSGFVFYVAICDDALAGAASASRLCFKSDELTRDYVKKFADVEEKIIDIR